MIVGGILVVCGDGFEKLAGVPYHDYIEEALELAVTCPSCWAALVTNALFPRLPHGPGTA